MLSISLRLLSVPLHLRLELGLSERIKDSAAFVFVVLIPNWRESVDVLINTTIMIPYL